MNLAQHGIQISESRFFDIATYAEIIEIELVHTGGANTRKATQSDIDLFLL